MTEETAGQLGAEISIPQMVARQMHRPNALGTPEEYYHRNVFIPYLDSLRWKKNFESAILPYLNFSY